MVKVNEETIFFDKAKERKAYLDGVLTHDEYYLKWAGALDKVTIQNVLETQGYKLTGSNKTKLQNWDRLQPLVSRLMQDAYFAKRVSAPQLTLSEVVCITKAVAKELGL